MSEVKYIERGLFNNYRAVLKHGIQIPETESQKGKRKGIRNQISMMGKNSISHTVPRFKCNPKIICCSCHVFAVPFTVFLLL